MATITNTTLTHTPALGRTSAITSGNGPSLAKKGKSMPSSWSPPQSADRLRVRRDSLKDLDGYTRGDIEDRFGAALMGSAMAGGARPTYG